LTEWLLATEEGLCSIELDYRNGFVRENSTPNQHGSILRQYCNKA